MQERVNAGSANGRATAAPVGNAAVGNVDNTFTGSIRRLLPTEHNAVNTNATSESGTGQSAAPQSGRGNWGRR
ncbi:DUF680 domain-containing protein [Mesorhizobium sp.]|uniref:DUF680 domain-containing protein n=1 Tax=unclassified Mesorhizobium TaxID=325217 RepID=UPI00345A274E